MLGVSIRCNARLSLNPPLRSASLRRAVLERAFRGELVPHQDPADEPAELLLARIRAERDASELANRRARRTVRG